MSRSKILTKASPSIFALGRHRNGAQPKGKKQLVREIVRSEPYEYYRITDSNIYTLSI
jgi:hypothetical protein